jgi:predicted enzyme related to lactoylglutathione lyase
MGGVYTAANERAAPPNWLGYVFVPDTTKAVDKLRTTGGQLVNGPMEVPGGDLIAVAVDPQGAAFAVHSRNPAAAAKPASSAAPAKAGSR